MKKKTLVIGGTKGIGKAITEVLSNHECIIVSRSESSLTNHVVMDAMTGDLPEIDGLTGLVYCPGSINLKPFHRLTQEDFINDYQINVLGAVRVLEFYFRTLKKTKVPLSYLVQLLVNRECPSMPLLPPRKED